MQLITTDHYELLSKRVAILVAAQVARKRNSVLGVATGSSPVGAYHCLVQMYREGYLDFSEVSTVNLDEYLGIDPSNEQSYTYYMKKQLFQSININPDNTYIPDSNPDDPDAECENYDRMIELLGGVDLQILGIGSNGHIGFNEPSDMFKRKTHIVELAESTIENNAKHFASKDLVPQRAITVGVGTIMKARRIVLIAYGENKAEALYKALFEEVTPNVPASVLQLHSNVTVVADQGAARWIAERGGGLPCYSSL